MTVTIYLYNRRTISANDQLAKPHDALLKTQALLKVRNFYITKTDQVRVGLAHEVFRTIIYKKWQNNHDCSMG